MFDKAILHINLDAFFVSIETLKNSALLGKPLIIGHESQTGVVLMCSAEARKYGIRPGLPMKMARRLCPQAIVRRRDESNHNYYSNLVTNLIQDEAFKFEKSTISEFYLDLTGMDKHFGCYKWALELRALIQRETGLSSSFGLSINKLVSKVGTLESRPTGTKKIPLGTERDFLAPLPTSKMPGVGLNIYKRLSFMGVRTIRVLSEIPVELLIREFGKTGRSLWENANAIDRRPVIPYVEQKTISKEQILPEDTLDLNVVLRILNNMTDELCFELREQHKLAGHLTVKIGYLDGQAYLKKRKIPRTANTKKMTQVVLELFERLYAKRQIIRQVEITLGGLIHGYDQISLFDQPMSEINLVLQMDRIRRRFGRNAINMGASFTNNRPAPANNL